MFKGLLMILLLLEISNAQDTAKTEIKIYDEAIELNGKIGKEWKLKSAEDCVPHIETSPKGKKQRVILARIPMGKQSLKLENLPGHSHVRVQFDLILKGSWDGTHEKWGPDVWRFDIDDGFPLVNSSFCNYSANLKQSFPDYHGDKYKVNKYYTGAAESETLGYTWAASQGPLAADSVYHFDFQIPHSSGEISLNFESIFNDVGGPEANKDQWYGLDNIVVSVVNHPQQFPEKEIKENIDLLKSMDANKRHMARIKLMKSDIAFVKWLENATPDAIELNIKKWVEELASPIHATREAATQKLLKEGVTHQISLKKMFAETDDPEVRARLQHLFEAWGSVDDVENHYNYELEVERLLKIINTPKAKKLLVEMSKKK